MQGGEKEYEKTFFTLLSSKYRGDPLLASGRAGGPAAGKAKNVIVLIVDGCSSEQVTFARWFKGKPLALDAIQVGAVKTYVADSIVADSAPAAKASWSMRRRRAWSTCRCRPSS